MRYHLQRIRSGEWLSRDFPVRGGSTTTALSGPGAIGGSCEPLDVMRRHTDGLPFLDPWSTAIYAEDAGGNLSGGIVQRRSWADGLINFEAPGFTSYPQGMPFTGLKGFPVRSDPMDVFRYLWEYTQSFRNGNLGLVVDRTKSTSRIGTNEEPYGLTWWSTLDMGAEMDSLAQAAPFDYAERHSWTAGKADVDHRVQLGTPRLGAMRTNLRFVEGENIVMPVDFDEDGYANEIHGVGSGEGSKSIRVSTAVDDGRLRRVKVYTDKTATKARMQALVAAQLRKMIGQVAISQVVVVDHPNARLSDIGLGDDIGIQTLTRGRERATDQVRVLSVERIDESQQATLNVAPSASFNYSQTFAEGVVYETA